MSVTSSEFASRINESAQSRVHSAAGQLYNAECAWHDARQTHVDAWILAASAKLDEAIANHLAAVAATTSGVSLHLKNAINWQQSAG